MATPWVRMINVVFAPRITKIGAKTNIRRIFINASLEQQYFFRTKITILLRFKGICYAKMKLVLPFPVAAPPAINRPPLWGFYRVFLYYKGLSLG
jgi:hypothetical protein